MDLFILWTSDVYNEDEKNVIGIYQRKDSALKKIKEIAIEIEIDVSYKDLSDSKYLAPNELGEISAYREEEYFISKSKINPTSKNIFFIEMEEEDNSLRYIKSYYLFDNIKDSYDKCMESFDVEHNRENECESCEKEDECRNALLRKLRRSHKGYFEGTDMNIDVKITTIRLNEVDKDF